jgi:hypothetical protein
MAATIKTGNNYRHFVTQLVPSEITGVCQCLRTLRIAKIRWGVEDSAVKAARNLWDRIELGISRKLDECSVGAMRRTDVESYLVRAFVSIKKR